MVFRSLQKFSILLVLLILLAGLPAIFYDAGGVIHFDPERLVSHSALLFKDVMEGTLGTYTLGKNERQIADDIFPFATNSFILLFSSLAVSIALSLLIGVFLHRFRAARAIEKVIGWVSVIPDFIIIMYSLIAATSFYQLTGIRLITLSPFDENRSLWLPVLILSIAPTTYLLKIVSIHYYQVRGQDFIGLAMSKGLSISHMNLHHVFNNILPYFLSDLKKAISITLTNLFLVEYLLNVKGITSFIFTHDYQFSLALIGFFTLLTISLLAYFLLRTILILFKKGFIYE